MKRLGIAAESAANSVLVTGLADRVGLESVDWIEAEHLGAYRAWCGIWDETWLDLHATFGRARSRRLPVYGHFGGEPGALDAQMYRCVFLLFADDSTCPDLIVVARDTDGFVERAATGSRGRCWVSLERRKVRPLGWGASRETTRPGGAP